MELSYIKTTTKIFITNIHCQDYWTQHSIHKFPKICDLTSNDSKFIACDFHIVSHDFLQHYDKK